MEPHILHIALNKQGFRDDAKGSAAVAAEERQSSPCSYSDSVLEEEQRYRSTHYSAQRQLEMIS
jgi:hypothetical protein